MVRHGGLIQSGEGGGVGRLPQFQAVSEMRCHTHSRTGVGSYGLEPPVCMIFCMIFCIFCMTLSLYYLQFVNGSDVPSSSEEEPEEEPESESEESEQEV